jgi:hypothetical protein
VTATTPKLRGLFFKAMFIIRKSYKEPEFYYWYDEKYNIYRPCDGPPFLEEEELLEVIEKMKRSLSFYKKNKKQIQDINEQWHIDEWIKEYDRREREEQEREISKNQAVKKQETNIYVMKDNHTGHYKIGRSKNPTQREATLLSQKSSIELLFYFTGPSKLEREIQEMFSGKRLRGEWFELTGEDLQSIKKIGGLL